MKPFSFLLGCSLLANGVLAVYFATLLPEKRRANTDATPLEKTSANALSTRGGAASGAHEANVWNALAPDDLHPFKDRLTAAGFPPKLVEAILKRKIYEKFAARYKALGGWYFETSHFQNLEVWQSSAIDFNSPERQAEADKIFDERVALQTELLGRNATLAANFDEQDRYRYRYLPPEKADALILLDRDYGAIKMVRGSSARLSRNDRDLLAEEQRRDLEALLTPEELYEHDLRTSRTAASLVQDLKAFQPTESEFRALFPVYQNGLRASGIDAAKEREADVDWSKLRETQKAQIEAVLGPSRYADFRQAVEPDAGKLNLITTRLGLPLSTAAEVTSTQKELTQRAESIRSDVTLVPSQRDAQLAALPNEAEAKITAALGAKGFAVYKEYSGAWLGKLQNPSSMERR